MLLKPSSYLQGPQRALVRVRPWRFAFIVPDDDAQAVGRVIAANCLLWGGMENLLVPYSEDTGVDDEWSEIVSLHDPDVMVDCVGIPQSEERRHTRLGRQVIQWDTDAPAQLALHATTIYSTLYVLNRRASLPTIIVPDLPEDDPLYLVALARWGTIHDEPLTGLRNRSGIRPEVKVSDLTSVVAGSWSSRESILLGEPPRSAVEQDASSGNSLTPITLTGHLLQRRGEGFRIPLTSPERPLYPEAFATMVIVTGRADSIRDLCLFWALRRQLPSTPTFPLWIPLDLLASEPVRDALRAAQASPPPQPFLAPEQGLRVVSYSSASEEIQEALSTAGVDPTIETARLHRYLGRRVHAGFEEEVEIRFDQRRGQFLPPRVETIEQMIGSEPLALDVELPAFRLPPLASLASILYGTVDRVSRTGIVMRLNASRRRELLTLHLPTWWDTIDKLFASAGFAAEPSDKSRLALAVLDMLGGEIADVDVLASSKIYGLLESMSTARERAAELRFVESRRPDIGPGELAEHLGTQFRDPIVNWLLHRRIIVRGARVSCPRCRLTHWYEFDRLDAYRFRCDGCFNEMLLPLDVSKTEWRYRINELFARAFDQGVLPVLRTILASWDPLQSPMQSPRREQTMGFFPGIELRDQTGALADEGLSHVDVDFLELFDGRLIIGECKVDANSISENQLHSYGKLGKLLNCSRLVISSIVPLSQENRARVCKVLAEYVEHVDLVITKELTDRTTGQRARLKYDEATGEPASTNPTKDPEAYLGFLLKYRINQDSC